MDFGVNTELEMKGHAGAGAGIAPAKALKNVWRFEAFDRDGNLKWSEEFENLVVNEGLDDSLDKHLKGSAYTATWYVGLTDGTPTFDPTDTLASHSGWGEVQAYDEAGRPSATFGTVSGGSVDNSGNKAVFSINTNGTTLGGAFLADDATKGGTTGILYGGGAFSAGDKVLDSGDSLQVTVTCTAAAA